MLTLAEAAQRLGLAHATLRWQIRNGKLRARKVGPIWTVSEREVERYRKESRREQPELDRERLAYAINRVIGYSGPAEPRTLADHIATEYEKL